MCCTFVDLLHGYMRSCLDTCPNSSRVMGQNKSGSCQNAYTVIHNASHLWYMKSEIGTRCWQRSLWKHSGRLQANRSC
jgi:hypothetical protein